VVADTTVVRLVDSAKGLDPLTIISLLIGFLGFLFGTYQFLVSRRWKRIEYMDSLIKQFREEPLLVTASVLLDWTVRPVKIGERVVDYCVEMLPHSLADHHQFTDPEKEGFDDDEVAIRDAFDAMLDFLGNIQYAVQLGMIRHKDVFIHRWRITS